MLKISTRNSKKTTRPPLKTSAKLQFKEITDVYIDNPSHKTNKYQIQCHLLKKGVHIVTTTL